MLKVKLHKQSEGYCGPTSLRMVLSYYKVNRSEKELAKLVKATHKHGCNPQDLVKGAKSLGFKAELLKNLLPEESMEKLEQIVNNEKIPVIVDWLPPIGDHYCVIIGVGKKVISYADPYYGKIKKVHKDDFLEHWLGFYHNVPKDHSDILLRGMIIIRKKE